MLNQYSILTILLAEVDGLKMRAKEALGLCTKKAVRDCRVAEIRQSLLNSQRLQEDYFVTHENDLLALRHDAKLKVRFLFKLLHRDLKVL